MDSTLFSVTGLGLRLADAKDYTARLLMRARARGELLVVNVHSNSYSAQSPDIRDWYRWFVKEIIGRSDVFITDFRGLGSRLVPSTVVTGAVSQ
jgi:hypothetical protein